VVPSACPVFLKTGKNTSFLAGKISQYLSKNPFMSRERLRNLSGPHLQFYAGFSRRPGRVLEGLRSDTASQTALGASQQRNQPPAQSHFLQQRLFATHAAVDSLEKIKSVWHCKECDADVEITNEKNQIECASCRSKHLEAPRRPRRGLVLAR
jgi:DNA-directed RNA polymerase subunit RPC12/RpoP